MNKQNDFLETYSREEELVRKQRLEEEALAKKKNLEQEAVAKKKQQKKLHLEEDKVVTTAKKAPLSLSEEAMVQDIATNELELLRKNGKLKDLGPEEIRGIEVEIIAFVQKLQKNCQKELNITCLMDMNQIVYDFLMDKIQFEMSLYKVSDECVDMLENKKIEGQKSVLSEKLFNLLNNKNNPLGSDFERLGIIISKNELQKNINSIDIKDIQKLVIQIESGTELSENHELWDNSDFKKILGTVLSNYIISVKYDKRENLCLELSRKYPLSLDLFGIKFENGIEIEPQYEFNNNYQPHEEKIRNKNKLYL
ncbi:MAG: hypothetical protein H0V82_05300 [Candidatus Protochlamydia sp.]|nr:hypothetical protein [Candidatus Protochlamydia sp.]